MPNLINTDSAGNVFYNYITPVIKGEAGSDYNANVLTYYQTALGSSNVFFSFPFLYVRFPAPGIENKTGTLSGSNFRVRFYASTSNAMGNFIQVDTGNANGLGSKVGVDSGGSGISSSTSDLSFKVTNQYATCHALFSSNMTFKSFCYAGWLREPVYSGATYPRGLVVYQTFSSVLKRVEQENQSTLINLSQSADSITSPPIVCTAGTDPGDGSAIATDIVIRDAASPNHPVGKLWNCIDLPADCVVGSIYRNAGNYDADASTSEKDFYLCVMPWGTRKLGMRIWTENVN